LRLADTSRKLGASRKRPRIRKLLQFKKQKFLILARPLSRLQQAKNFSERREAKLLTRNASKPLGRAWCGHARSTSTLVAGKIWCGQILPLCPKKEQKNHIIFKGRDTIYIILIVIIFVNIKCYL
jgi:hypothetical protein